MDGGGGRGERGKVMVMTGSGIQIIIIITTKRQKAVCSPADIWVLSADCQWDVKGRRKKKRKKRSYITELLKQRDTDRQTGDEDRAPERDKKGKHITLSSDKDKVMVVPPTQTPNRQRADVSCEVLNIQELHRSKGITPIMYA